MPRGAKRAMSGARRRSSRRPAPQRAANTGPGEVDAVYTEGDELYRDMLADIAAARREVSLESYIFADDEVGRGFAGALIDAAAGGRTVRVLVDSVGSSGLMSDALRRRLLANGVGFRWFQTWHWRRPLRYNRRDHRKLLAIDGEIAYFGGFNLHRENSRQVYGEMRWRDTHVRVTGALAAQAGETFELFWDPGFEARDGEDGRAGTFLLSTHQRVTRRELRDLFAREFDQARERILLTTPYFVPDRIIQRGLRRAAERGVDVRLLVPGKNDVRVVQWAGRAVYGNLLQAGVSVYEYLPRVLHAKTVVVDGDWATVGTANMDYRSLFANYELNLVSRSADLVGRLEGQFYQDLEQARRIRPRVWNGRGAGDRLAELVGWLARRWL